MHVERSLSQFGYSLDLYLVESSVLSTTCISGSSAVCGLHVYAWYISLDRCLILIGDINYGGLRYCNVRASDSW
jgi:hypothetical protein